MMNQNFQRGFVVPDGRSFTLLQDLAFQKTNYPIIAEPDWQ